MTGLFVGLESWLAEIGVWAYLVAPSVMALVSILPIPAEAPAMANGVLFGPVVGSVVTWSGAVIGAWVSYELARTFGRPLADRFISAESLQRIDSGVESAGWAGLVGLRLIPVAAFTAINWGAGLCGVPRGRFLWTTAIGIIPGVVVFTASGAGFVELYERAPVMATLLGVALLAGAVVWGMRRRVAAA